MKVENKLSLTLSNNKYLKKNYAGAMLGYLSSLIEMHEIADVISANIKRCQSAYKNNLAIKCAQSVVVCSWEIAHNAVGRAHSLAQVYLDLTPNVQIVGCAFTQWGVQPWEPIRNSKIPIHFFVAEPNNFLFQAIELVASHPADIVHLSKPRGPNIIFGILYKMLWGAKILVDIDDDELAFVNADKEVDICKFFYEYRKSLGFSKIYGKIWTQISVGLLQEFDGVTVSNVALQARYGGTIIAHARDEARFKNSVSLKISSRIKFGIAEEKKVVLFAGTPREHKGLFEIALAIQKLHRNDVVFFILGTFDDNNDKLKKRLLGVEGVSYVFLENVPFEELPEIVSIADCCVLYQDNITPASNYQIPAKLSDALAMGLPVIVSPTLGLSDVIAANAVFVTTSKELSFTLNSIIDKPDASVVDNGKNYYRNNLSITINAHRLRNLIGSISNGAISKKLFYLLKNIRLGEKEIKVLAGINAAFE